MTFYFCACINQVLILNLVGLHFPPALAPTPTLAVYRGHKGTARSQKSSPLAQKLSRADMRPHTVEFGEVGKGEME